MSAIQNAAAGTAAASFVASQIGNSIAGTFGMGYAKFVVGQAAWAASVGALGEKMANGTATGGDYANVIQNVVLGDRPRFSLFKLRGLRSRRSVFRVPRTWRGSVVMPASLA